MKRVVLAASLLLNFVECVAQSNTLYRAIFTHRATMPSAMCSRPTSYLINLSFGGESKVLSGSTVSGSWNVSGTATLPSKPTYVSFADGYTSGFYSLGANVTSGGETKPFTVSSCSGSFLSASTSFSFFISPIVFEINSPNSAKVCGVEPVTLAVSQDPTSSYNWYVREGETGPWLLFKSSAGRYMTFNQAELPGGIDRQLPVYFKASTMYDGQFVETSISSSITFYPGIPTRASLVGQRASCPDGWGSVTISDLRLIDNSQYDASKGDVFAHLESGEITLDARQLTSNSLTISGLRPGSWNVKLTNTSQNCMTDLGNVIVPAAPAAISATASVQNATCSGGTGSIFVTSSGGTGSHQYSLDGSNFQSASTFSGLSPGNYRVTLRDANGCIGVSNPVTVTAPSPVTLVEVGKTHLSGFGLANGMVVLSVSGGNSSTYSYSINGGAFVSSSTFSGLAAGAYRFVAKDANGCLSNQINVTLSEPPPLQLTVSLARSVSCFGNSDGRLTAVASGGTSGYEYSLTGIFPSGKQEGDYSFLSAGNYLVYVRDSNGNIASVGTTIGSPTSLSLNLSKTDATCAGAGNGAISAVVTGGTGPYKYSIDGLPYISEGNFSSVSAGVHSITIVDNNGCTVSGAISVLEPPPLSIQISEKTDLTCNGGMDGAVRLSTAGGVGNYQYAIDSQSFQSSASFTGLRAGTHLVTVKDGTGCVSNITFSLKEPPPIFISEDLDLHRNVSCNGASDGKIVIGSAGGTGIVRYKLGGEENLTGIFEGLKAGIQVISVTDGRGCGNALQVLVTEPAALSMAMQIAQPSCFGQGDGSITINGSGGTGDYTYSLNNGGFQSTNAFSSLSAGTYKVTIRDISGCEKSENVTVSQPDVLSITLNQHQNVSCFSGLDGVISVKANGGNGGYTYTMVGTGTSNSTGTFSDLPAGSYRIQVQDAKGCVAELQTSLIQPRAAVTISIAPRNLSCFQAGNGQLTVAANGGTGPYLYAINGGSPQAEPAFPNLSAGSYTVMVSDVNGCSAASTVELFEPEELKLSTKEMHIVCNGDASGEIEVFPSGGTGPYLFSINEGAYQASERFLSLKAGVYSVNVKDAAGCLASTSVELRNLYDPISVELESLSPSTCLETGIIRITSVTGGLPPYTYSLNRKDFSSQTGFEGLANGVYAIFVKDSNGCIASEEGKIIVPTAIRANLVAVKPACNGESTGSVSVLNTSGANGNYLYSLDGQDFTASAKFQNLSAGVYVITIKDQPFSCQSSYTVVLEDPPALEIRLLSKSDPSCRGNADGRAEIQVTGGSAPYLLDVDGQLTGSFRIGHLAAGDHSVHVVDGSGCVAELQVRIEDPPLLTFELVGKKSIMCHGASDGSLEVVAKGGVPPYRYRLNEGPLTSSAEFTNLPAGTYRLSVVDSRGCVRILQEQLAEPEAPVSVQLVSLTKPTCWGARNGMIVFSISGGVGAYRYKLNGQNLSEMTVSGLSAGSYTVLATDSQGCSGELKVVLGQPKPLTVNTTLKHPSCFNDCNGEITMEVSGGTKPYTIDWLSTPVLNGELRGTGLCAGTYQILVTDAEKCSQQVQLVLNNPDQIIIPEGVRDTILCVGQSVVLDARNAGASYLWKGDNGFRSSEQVVTLSASGKYTVTVAAANGCQVSRTFSVSTSTSVLKADFLASTFVARNDTLVLVDVSKPVPEAGIWDLPATARIVQKNSNGSIIHAVFSETGTFEVGLNVKLGECNDRLIKLVTVLPPGDLGAVNKALGYKGNLLQELKVFPNPSSGNFNVKLLLNEKADVQISLISYGDGKIIESRGVQGRNSYEFTFNRPELVPAVYMLLVKVQDEVYSVKVIKS